MFEKLKKQPWYPTATAICIGVLLYVLLAHFSGIWNGVTTFIGFFKPLIWGCVLAYMINPLCNLFYSIFEFIKKPKLRKAISNSVAFIVVILFIVFAVIILIPQLIDGIQTLSANLPQYVTYVERFLENRGISKTTLDVSRFIDTSESVLGNAVKLISDNIENVLEASANVGKVVARILIAFVLSVYLIAEKDVLKGGANRLLRASVKPEKYDDVLEFFKRTDWIFNRYIVFNLVDSIIIGGLHAILMTIFGMQYVGLISFIVGLTNLVPTFGPLVGAAIGALLLLMENPMHALIFIIITLVLQILDGYIIKPRLFGSQLGVSGLWILVGIIAGGNMFGVIGILIAIPVVAVLDFIYSTYLVPSLEKKRGIVHEEEAAIPDKATPKKE
ncbi:MAG: AI-2E family transporter [Clostridia bacterium]|nr:AI-2E family transporter [Clostridia bacterium]